jgi:sulfonate transport system substrate-binding protein
MDAASRRMLLLGAGLAPLVQRRPRAAEPPSLRIAYLKAPNDLALARAHGTLERALAPMGVAVQWAGPFAAAAPAVEALNAGAVDMTVGSSTSFITSLAGGVRLVLFAYQKIDRAAEGILVGRGSAAAGLRDLVGRQVAVNRGGTGEYVLVRALTTAGLGLDQVRRVYLGPVDANAAFTSGAVEGWAIWDPFLSIAVAGGARVLADGAQCGSENAIAYFVRQAFLEQHRAVVQAVFAVLRSENAWARANMAEAGAIWARDMGLDAALGGRLGQNNTPPLGAVGVAEAATVERIADWYAENRIVPQRPAVRPFLVDLAS